MNIYSCLNHLGDSLLNKVLKLSKTKKGHNYHLISSADQYNVKQLNSEKTCVGSNL